jgi:hypothetical protein
MLSINAPKPTLSFSGRVTIPNLIFGMKVLVFLFVIVLVLLLVVVLAILVACVFWAKDKWNQRRLEAQLYGQILNDPAFLDARRRQRQKGFIAFPPEVEMLRVVERHLVAAAHDAAEARSALDFGERWQGENTPADRAWYLERIERAEALFSACEKHGWPIKASIRGYELGEGHFFDNRALVA